MPEKNFEGYEERRCGEHRTVGPHRAWCFNDTEWCYPQSPCRGCEIGFKKLMEIHGVPDAAWIDSMASQLEAMPRETFVEGLTRLAEDVSSQDNKLSTLARLMVLEAIRRIEAK